MGRSGFLLLAYLSSSASLNHKHSALGEFFQMLQEGVSEADNVLQELLRVFGRLVHLECKETNSHYVISEDERTKDVGVFAILLRDLVRLRATRH